MAKKKTAKKKSRKSSQPRQRQKISELSEAEKKRRINAILEEGAEETDRATLSRLRDKLRKLGHKGGFGRAEARAGRKKNKKKGAKKKSRRRRSADNEE